MAITEFRGSYWFLSNFYPSPIRTSYAVWPTAEHLFQACKTSRHADWDMILSDSNPAHAKRCGRVVKLRDGWESQKVAFMTKVAEAKFKQNPNLMQMLIATGNEELIEGNTWNDTFWGVCRGRGSNHLGKILMQVRDCTTATTTVHNIKHVERPASDVYIGRAGHGENGYWGNPVKANDKCPVCGNVHTTPVSTLPCYRVYLTNRLANDEEFASRFRQLKGRRLLCFCKPNPCHGDIMVELLSDN